MTSWLYAYITGNFFASVFLFCISSQTDCSYEMAFPQNLLKSIPSFFSVFYYGEKKIWGKDNRVNMHNDWVGVVITTGNKTTSKTKFDIFWGQFEQCKILIVFYSHFLKSSCFREIRFPPDRDDIHHGENYMIFIWYQSCLQHKLWTLKLCTEF